MNKKHFTNAEDLLEYLRRSAPQWQADTSGKWDIDWIFRGHSDETWDLAPSALRSPCIKQIQDYKESVLTEIDSHWKNQLSIPYAKESPLYKSDYTKRSYAHIYAERRIIKEFCQQAEGIGQSIPGSEHYINADLWVDNFPLPSKYNGVGITSAIAQHHGIPTRLLDFTSNPLTAAFFSCYSILKPIDKKNLCIWAIKKESIMRKAIELSTTLTLRPSVFEVPRKNFEYLNAQEALFVQIHGATNFYATYGRWPSLNRDVLTDSSMQSSFMKLTLPQSEASELYRLLTIDGCSLSSLMPTLDSIAKDVKIRWAHNTRNKPCK